MKKHIVCFGDSNTHGYDGDTGGRFNESERWTCLLQKNLGDDYLVIEEGLSGRTTAFDDPLTEGLNSVSTINPIIMSHEPIDLLIIMLGTNDTKSRFSLTPNEISFGLERLIKKAKNTECWKNNKNILIVVPKNIDEEYEKTDILSQMGPGCAKKSKQLSVLFTEIASKNACYFFDANTLNISNNRTDYMHLDKESHFKLAEALSKQVKEIIK